MGGVHKVNQPQNQGASISIAMSLTQGLGNAGGAQAFAGPNGAFAQAGNPGGLGSFAGGPQGPNGNALAGNFGGPQNPQQAGFQAGFQQGKKAAKMRKLMGKLRRLMSQMGMGGGFPQGPGGLAAPGGAFASAGPNGAFASARPF